MLDAGPAVKGGDDSTSVDDALGALESICTGGNVDAQDAAREAGVMAKLAPLLTAGAASAHSRSNAVLALSSLVRRNEASASAARAAGLVEMVAALLDEGAASEIAQLAALALQSLGLLTIDKADLTLRKLGVALSGHEPPINRIAVLKEVWPR